MIDFKGKLQEQYGYIFSEGLINKISEVGIYKQVEPQNELIGYGEVMKYIPLILSGAVKIMRENSDGKELLLYYLEKGDTCAFTLNCSLGNKTSEIRAVTETQTEAIMIPFHYIDQWICEFPEWRSFVLQSYFYRVNEMIDTIDSVAFTQMDERLWRYLSYKAMVLGSTHLNLTHQTIADEMNTSRVVVSRLLKKLENQGKVVLGRNEISLKNF